MIYSIFALISLLANKTISLFVLYIFKIALYLYELIKFYRQIDFYFQQLYIAVENQLSYLFDG